MKSPPSVCAFVSNLSSEATDCRPVTFAHEWIMTIARRGLKVKVMEQAHGTILIGGRFFWFKTKTYINADIF